MKSIFSFVIFLFFLACTPAILPEREYASIDMSADIVIKNRLDIPLIDFIEINTGNWSYSDGILYTKTYCNTQSGYAVLKTPIPKNLDWKTVRLNIRTEYKLGSPVQITAFNHKDINNLEDHTWSLTWISPETTIGFEFSPRTDLSIGFNVIGAPVGSCLNGWSPLDLQYFGVKEVWVEEVK